MIPATRRAAAWLALVAWAVLLLATPARADTGRVVVVGTGGFTWADVTPDGTPNLWELLRTGSAATFSIRSVNPNTCPVDGWLALSAGERAAAAGADGDALRPATERCPALPHPTGATVPGWAAYVATADSLRFGAEPGQLGDLLAAAGVPTVAIGPGAALALAGRDGAVAAYANPDLLTATAQQLREAFGDARVAVVDVGAAREIGADPEDARADPAQVREIDARIGAVLARLADTDTVIVAGLADGGPAPRLRPIVVRGPGFGAGILTSPSTRTPGLAQSGDLPVTLLKLTGVPVPRSLGGGLVSVAEQGTYADEDVLARRTALIDIDQASHEIRPLVPIFFAGLIGAQLLIYLVVWRVWSSRTSSLATRSRLIRAVQVIAVAAASVPAATFLANLLPWWRSSHPLPAIVGSVAVFVALIAGLALLPPWGRRLLGPVAVVSLATLAVLAIDVMTGSRLQVSTLMGLQPVVGGRYYGMGNVTFSIFATASVLLAIALAHRLLRTHGRAVAVAAVIILGVATVIVDGNPAWGADGGGPPAYLPGLAYFVLALLGIRMTVRRALLIAVVTAGLFLLVGFLDSLRPPESQSHLGRFFDELGQGTALDIVIRKAEQNWGILISNPLSLLVPFALFFVIFVLLRPTSWGSRSLHRSFERVPTLRPGLIAWLIVMTIGFFINDSGVAIPAVGATVAIPLVIAIAARVLLEESAGEQPPGDAPRRDPSVLGRSQ